MSDVIPQKDYKTLKFTKNDKDIIKRIKDYAIRNCRNEVTQFYITKTLNLFDFGISYFRTEILKINKSIKTRPCAFACVQKLSDNKLYLLLVCSIHNNDELGKKIMNEILLYSMENNFIEISLECDEKLIDFYKKFGFVEEKIVEDDMHYMVKILN